MALVLIVFSHLAAPPKLTSRVRPLKHPDVHNTADVPFALRVSNYRPYGQGSCVHASTATMLNYKGRYLIAEWWKSNHHSGQTAYGIINDYEIAELDYAYTIGDVEFLEWASRNRQVVGIWYYYRHCVNFLGFTETHAILLDNNSVSGYDYILKDEFIYNWINTYGGFAFVVMEGNTPPPKPVWR